ncbi:hypothetical protein [Kitasatospora cinereorecta]|uniref:Uncharacterized protein n=1 Tax=Kitasatospora cinereorecta TaxID=285560 RepID=A0ABW0VKL5_9ACTN
MPTPTPGRGLAAAGRALRSNALPPTVSFAAVTTLAATGPVDALPPSSAGGAR